MTIDIAALNDDWLDAWSRKDVPVLLSFYADDLVYIDPQIPQGVRGKVEFADYLTKLFAAIPQVRYLADQVWPSADGYFGRWYGDIEGETRRLRGFDVITLRQGLIVFNEVYTHSIEAPA